MLLSVLITTYAGEEPANLQGALKSIIDDQTVQPDQVVLVLDGPVTAELDEVVRDFCLRHPSMIELVRLPRNVGQGAASREGAKYCDGELIARMDSDDISVPTRFAKQLSVFEQNPNVSLVGGLISEFDDSRVRRDRVRVVPERHEEIIRMMRFRNPVNNMSVMFKRSALDEAGGYTAGRVIEDYSLFVRMVASGSVFENLQEILVRVRAGRTMAARRGDFEIVKSWTRTQRILLSSGLTSPIKAILSIANVAVFVAIPPLLKSLLYESVLRSKTAAPEKSA